MRKTSPIPAPEAAARLADFFQRSGCFRLPNLTRRAADGANRYKKGYEIRFSVRTKTKLNELRRLLKALRFAPGTPYQKGTVIVQPVYGKEEVLHFSELLREQDAELFAEQLDTIEGHAELIPFLPARKPDKPGMKEQAQDLG